MTEIVNDNIIILRSVYGKVGQKYFIQPCRDKKTKRLPDCVKKVNSRGDMIMTDDERNSGKVFIPENRTFTVEDGTTFDLSDEYQKAEWDSIKNCLLIAPSRYSKDENGNYLIDGTIGKNSTHQRYGVAELYIYKPAVESKSRVSRKKRIHEASSFILDDDGIDGLVKHAKLLGKHMSNMPASDIEDYLLQIAEKDPEKIINIYRGSDSTLRLLFIDALDKHVIYSKNKLYIYGDNIVLGATDEAVITFMKEASNKKIVELIRRNTYPQYEEKSDSLKTDKTSKKEGNSKQDK